MDYLKAFLELLKNLSTVAASPGGLEWIHTQQQQGLTDQKLKEKAASLIVVADPDR